MGCKENERCAVKYDGYGVANADADAFWMIHSPGRSGRGRRAAGSWMNSDLSSNPNRKGKRNENVIHVNLIIYSKLISQWNLIHQEIAELERNWNWFEFFFQFLFFGNVKECWSWSWGWWGNSSELDSIELNWIAFNEDKRKYNIQKYWVTLRKTFFFSFLPLLHIDFIELLCYYKM